MIESEDTDAPEVEEPEFKDDPAPAVTEPDPEAVTPPPSDRPWVDAMIADLDGKTVEELHDIARSRGMSGYSSLSKDDLVDDIGADYRDNPPPEPRIG